MSTRVQAYEATRLQGYKATRLHGYKAKSLVPEEIGISTFSQDELVFKYD
jgi:hypothetical protein